MGRTSDAKERLIETAAGLTHARGINDVGVQEICVSAGVQKGSFYHFFKSKNDLAAAVLDKHWSDARNQYWRLAFGEDVAPLDRIRRFFQMAYFYFKQAHDAGTGIWGCPFGNAALEMATQNDAISEKVSIVFSDATTFFRQAIEEAARRGDISTQDPQQAAESLWAYYEGILVVAKARRDPEVIRRLGSEAINFLHPT
jgi:TetR/AcrR family transcriptional repressor of nem operon